MIQLVTEGVYMNSYNWSISSIRLISLLMIITCHILQGLGLELAFWFNIGVQIFFFISGYLYGKKDIKQPINFFTKRLKKILLPLSILIVIMIIIEKIYTNNTYSILRVTFNICGLGAFAGNIKTLTHTWFVTYILLCYLITPLLQKLFSSKKHSLFVLIVLFALSIIPLPLKFDATRSFNYILGYYYSRCCTSKKERKVFFISFLMLSILLLPINLITRYKLIENIPHILFSRAKLIHNIEHIFLGTVLFICLLKLFEKIKINECILKFGDKYSFFIYLTHQIFILNNFSVLHITNYLIINILLILVLSIVSGIILYYIYNATCKFADYIITKIKHKFKIALKKV